jgi:uncharacterized protein (UPF0332 family)
MKNEEVSKDVRIAEKAVLELTQAGDLKKLPEQLAHQIANFYEARCLNRLQSARFIYEASKTPNKYDLPEKYSDYSEVVAAAYYAMYYSVHAYLAEIYMTKLRENLRGVHAITHNLVVYYFVKTNKLVKHLYEEYVKTLETASAIQNLTLESFQEEAFKYAKQYKKSKEARETFTYKTTSSVESHHAERAIATAEEFVNIVRQLMLKK